MAALEDETKKKAEIAQPPAAFPEPIQTIRGTQTGYAIAPGIEVTTPRLNAMPNYDGMKIPGGTPGGGGFSILDPHALGLAQVQSEIDKNKAAISDSALTQSLIKAKFGVGGNGAPASGGTAALPNPAQYYGGGGGGAPAAPSPAEMGSIIGGLEIPAPPKLDSLGSAVQQPDPYSATNAQPTYYEPPKTQLAKPNLNESSVFQDQGDASQVPGSGGMFSNLFDENGQFVFAPGYKKSKGK